MYFIYTIFDKCLMGIHVITTGNRPELAQLAVNTGLDLSRGETYTNLKKALESLE
jgi:rsbT co-antagonist protein RsbR